MCDDKSSRGQYLDLGVAHHDPHRAPAGHIRHRVELPDDQRAAAVGLHHLDLKAVPGQIL
jgi:hypothetical protein